MDIDPDALSGACLAARDRLPDGWQLEGLRCGSTVLTPEQRCDDWVAVATGPPDPFAAIMELVDSLSYSADKIRQPHSRP